MLSLPLECRDCNKIECRSASNNIKTCRLGFDYVKIDKELIMIGFITLDINSNQKIKRKRIKEIKSKALHSSFVNEMLQNFDNKRNTYIKELEDQLEDEKEKIIKKLVDKKKKNVNNLVEGKQKYSFIHDYRQINTQLIQNVDVVMNTIFNVADIDKVEDPYFKSLYYGIQMLESKLDATSILLNPELLQLQASRKVLNFHGIVYKLCKIYEIFSNNKKIKIKFEGSNYQSVVADPDALPIIPQALIDNAIKYSPNNNDIIIKFNDEYDYVLFSITSYGPQILDVERKTIFEYSFRGANARETTSGSGLGLYLCNLVAESHLNTKIKVDQRRENVDGYYLTTFSIKIPFESK
jgi:signal transduction histidine kinase